MGEAGDDACEAGVVQLNADENKRQTNSEQDEIFNQILSIKDQLDKGSNIDSWSNWLQP